MAPPTDDGTPVADNLCRKKTPTAPDTSAKGSLFDEDASAPGRFKERFAVLAPSVSYTVFALGSMGQDEFAVEYDCGATLGVTK